MMDGELYSKIDITPQSLKAVLSGFDFEKLSPDTVLGMLLSYIIPGGEYKQMANRLLDRFGSVSAVLEADIDDIAAQIGVSDHKAALLRLVPAVGTYYQLDKFSGEKRFGCVQDIAEFAIYKFSKDNRESYNVVMLDSTMRMLGTEELAQGSECSVEAELEKLGSALFRYGASGYVLIHNHPATEFPYPSDMDVHTTKLIYELMAYFKKYMIEHIIVSGDSYMPIMQLMRKNGYTFTQ